MSASFGNDLVYPDLTTCELRLVGPGTKARPPIQLPQEIRDAASAPAFGSGRNSLDGFSLECAVLKRNEERVQDRGLRGSTSREELELATIAKMKMVTGADEAICIAMLKDHRYDVEESIEAYLETM